MTTTIITCCGATLIERISDHWRGWVTLDTCEHDTSIQVVPVDDSQEHAVKGSDCWCEPFIKFENGQRIVIHAAKDGRP